MNWDYAQHAFLILGLSCLLGLLLWAVGFGFYLNQIGSRGWASTRSLLRTLPAATLAVAVLCGAEWENHLVPHIVLAHAGLTSAQMAMAGRYVVGDRILRRNQAKARIWVARAANGGSADAMLVLAGMELNSRSGSDPASALACAKQAGARGLVDAKLLTGDILLSYPNLAQDGQQSLTCASREGLGCWKG
jgi:TPR repeat protein